MRFIPYVLLGLFLFGCADDEYPVKLETTQVGRLLTQNNSKAWLLENRETCMEDDTLTFSKAADAKSLGGYVKAKGAIYCPEESEEDITGTWEIISEANTNRLRLLGGEAVTYDIILITASRLHLRTAEGDVNYRTP